MTQKSPLVSIIIRTLDEERWIGHCLNSIFSQDFENFEVIIVDNNSTDNTIDVAKRFPISKIISIKKFFPGKALNDGVRESHGDYIVCISAHCIPKDIFWLRNLYENFLKNNNINERKRAVVKNT